MWRVSRAAPALLILACGHAPPAVTAPVAQTPAASTAPPASVSPPSPAPSGDPRTAALTATLASFEPGKDEAEIVKACREVEAMANEGRPIDPALADALWGAFDRFRPSQAKSIALVQALHEAVLAVKSAAYGPRAIAKLAVPVDANDRAAQMDQVQFAQLTSVQLVQRLALASAARPLVEVLFTPTKRDLVLLVEPAQLHIARESEALLVAALRGTDAELASKLAASPDNLAIAVDALGTLSRAAGCAAVLDAAPRARSDREREVFAGALTHCPITDRTWPAFKTLYDGLAPDAEPTTRIGMVRATLAFYDAKLAAWLIAEADRAKGAGDEEVQRAALEAAIVVTGPDSLRAVSDALRRCDTRQMTYDATGWRRVRAELDAAKRVLAQCQTRATCAVDVAAAAPPREQAIKALWISGAFAGAERDAVRARLTQLVPHLRDGATRILAVDAIDHLAPDGDPQAAGALEQIVSADRGESNGELLWADDTVARVALRLRARAR